ncbi:MAG TPA: hypothetical protein VMT37_10190 [Solirubrobacterales bacterium]|nr:hypothetical protein [Solirubrobacterales bacterium]
MNFEAGATGIASDADAGCTGTAAEPTAPAGKVFIYSTEAVFNPHSLSGEELRPKVAASRFGFSIQTGEASNTGYGHGIWAYTAP